MLLRKALWKVEQDLSCLQHRLIDLVKHGSHFPLLNFFTFKILLLSKTLLPPIMSLRILCLFTVKIGGSAKISFKFDSICKICQFKYICVIYIFVGKSRKKHSKKVSASAVINLFTQNCYNILVFTIFNIQIKRKCRGKKINCRQLKKKV